MMEQVAVSTHSPRFPGLILSLGDLGLQFHMFSWCLWVSSGFSGSLVVFKNMPEDGLGMLNWS